MNSIIINNIKFNKEFWQAFSQLSKSMQNFGMNSPEGISAAQFVELGKTLDEIAKSKSCKNQR